MARKLTPMMQQYKEEKAKEPDAFLFFRVGDFYELFFEDAVEAAQRLELTLTSRDKNSETPIPMCGVPHHAVDTYVDILVQQGFKVAICDQVEDPNLTKEMVKREIVQVVTPGTRLHEEQGENNYLVCLAEEEQAYSLAYADLSTGELKVTQLADKEAVVNECSQLQTKEIVEAKPLDATLKEELQQRLAVIFSLEEKEAQGPEVEALCQNIVSPALRSCIAHLIAYLERTQKHHLSHMHEAEFYEVQHYLQMDYYSKFNLELKQTIRSGKKEGTLYWLLNETKTAMGQRLLQRWIDRPLIQKTQIIERQNIVAAFLNHYLEHQGLIEAFKGVYDLERLVSKVAMAKVNARELLQLKQSLQQLPSIIHLLQQMAEPALVQKLQALTSLPELTERLEKALREDAPLSIQEGNMFKEGYDAHLDEYIAATQHGAQWILQLEQRERERLGIKNLRVKYNNANGYYIEISKAAAKQVQDERYMRKQTLTNAERFVTEELKTLEIKIAEAKNKRVEREYELFVELREAVRQESKRLQTIAETLASLDVLQAFATLANERHYVRPNFNEKNELYIIEGRHPVVEKVLGTQEYVPNDICMDAETVELLITGPNMSGKSTYMRQLALTVIMAQMGCFVPAKQANLPIFDRIFTRIGASDDLYAGKSTFMVEMMEANEALQHATAHSLILFDELGRGTATYDGMALAQAIIEYIQKEVRAKTLFSTHYHELTALAAQLSGVKNIHVGAKEEEGQLIFLHKMEAGPADESYGIQVARLAHLPESLLIRAQAILNDLEAQAKEVHVQPKGPTPGDTVQKPVKSKVQAKKNVGVATGDTLGEQLSLFGEEASQLQELRQLDLMNTSPLEALLLLHRWQEELKKG